MTSLFALRLNGSEREEKKKGVCTVYLNSRRSCLFSEGLMFTTNTARNSQMRFGCSLYELKRVANLPTKRRKNDAIISLLYATMRTRKKVEEKKKKEIKKETSGIRVQRAESFAFLGSATLARRD
jgi:hypothetical protein